MLISRREVGGGEIQIETRDGSDGGSIVDYDQEIFRICNASVMSGRFTQQDPRTYQDR